MAIVINLLSCCYAHQGNEDKIKGDAEEEEMEITETN
jgi:hypothetical protein